jgi:hypothetical protein
MRRSKSNVPAAALRWSIDRAALEFKLARGTLRKSLGSIGAKPDAGGCFSTGQITEALFGSMHIEKLGTQRELRRKLELENRITTASVLDKKALMAGLSQLADSMVARVMSHTELPRELLEDFLRDISELPVIVADVATRQSRLPRGGKHDGDEEASDDEDVDDETDAEASDEGGSQPAKARKTHFRRKPGFHKAP